MNVSCSGCHTVYRIDPRKVPDRGVRARCAICRGVFRVDPRSEAERGPAAAPSPPAATQSAAPPEPPVAAAPAPPPPPVAEAPRPPLDAPAAAPAAPEPSAPRSAAPRFGDPDPKAKARRLARALVSDMTIYNPERHQRGLAEGTLRQEFREEIRKSWEEYVEQVGRDTAHGTPFFRDALNEILARGQQVF